MLPLDESRPDCHSEASLRDLLSCATLLALLFRRIMTRAIACDLSSTHVNFTLKLLASAPGGALGFRA